MALYYHYANKDGVIDGMVDLVFSEIDLPAAGADWKGPRCADGRSRSAKRCCATDGRLA